MHKKMELTRIIIIRLIELLVPLIAFSAVGTWLSVFSFITTHTAILLILIVLNVPYFVIVSRRSKALFYGLRKKKIYLIVNAVSVAVLGMIIALVRYFASNEVFVWMFAITKLVYFLPFHIPLVLSVGAFMIVLVLVIWLSPRRIEYMRNRSKPDEFDSFAAKADGE